LNCQQVATREEGSTGLSCMNCGNFFLRKCDACRMAGQVPSGHKDGQPWVWVWCNASNSGFAKRKDPNEATIADLAFSLEQQGLLPAAPEPAPKGEPMLIVTMNEVPGYRIAQVHGDVFGLVVRAGNYFSNLGASLRTLAGGEVAGYTKLLTDSRNQARIRMWGQARGLGANAVVAMRFDCNEIGDIMSEIVAYGTAVTVEPLQAAAGTVLAAAVAVALAGMSGMRHLRTLVSGRSFRVVQLDAASTPTSQSQGTATTPTSCSWTAASTPKFADLAVPIAAVHFGPDTLRLAWRTSASAATRAFPRLQAAQNWGICLQVPCRNTLALAANIRRRRLPVPSAGAADFLRAWL
jgi:uncharacterized protein YbjQ (UPF0145 family)